MSLSLKSVELVNIRSHKQFKFEPAKNGVTALSGVNGSGKSTIVDSIAWTLFGTKPHGVSKVAAIINDSADLSKESCLARVEFYLHNVLYRVERRVVNKSGSVECELWERKDGKNFSQIAGPAVSHTEPVLRKLLNMDEKGFLAAILVQQKQVDQLISASPKERALVIERLTGIASITAALTEARSNYNTNRKLLQNYDIDPKRVSTLEKDVALNHSLINTKVDSLKKLNTKLDTTTEKHSKAKSELAQAREKASSFARYTNRVQELDESIQLLEADLKHTVESKEAKRRAVSDMSIGGDLDEVRGKVTKLKKDIRESERRTHLLETEKKEASKHLEEAQALIAESSFDSVDDLSEELTRVEETIATMRKDIAKLEVTLSVELANMNNIASAISVLSSGSGSCPTCLQEVSDLSVAVRSLKTEGNKHKKVYADSAEKRKSLNADLNELEATLANLETLKTCFQQVEECSSRLDEIDASLKNDSGTYEALVVELNSLERIYASLQYEDDVKKEYESLLERAKTLSRRLSSSRDELDTVKDQLKSLGKVNDGDSDRFEDALTKIEEVRNRLIESRATLSEEIAVLRTVLEHSSRDLKTAKTDRDKYQKLMKTVETSGKTVEVLEEFREARVKSSVPRVSEYASDLLSRFTDGKFTQLLLDEKFQATVRLSNGTVRPIGLLSGGELSSAAISLRLAISMLLNTGATHNMIVLDEVLVSQDLARSEQILNTLKEVCRGQVIMISHGSNTNEIADHIVELT